MSDILYCNPWEPVCGNYSCPKHIKNAPGGCAVSAADFSRDCSEYKPIKRITAKSYDDAKTRFIQYVKEMPDNSIEELKSVIEINGLTVSEIERLVRETENEVTWRE